jgi:uncharacterized membrane protein (DUF485 family)
MSTTLMPDSTERGRVIGCATVIIAFVLVARAHGGVGGVRAMRQR